MSKVSDEILMHHGMPRRSGRYPYGSGDNPYQHSGDFMGRVNELRKQGMSEKDVAKEVGLDSTTQLRVQYAHAKDEARRLEVNRIKSLQKDGMTPTEIAKALGYKNESSVRSKLNEDAEARMNAARATADILKKLVDEKGMIDVGSASIELNVSKNKVEEALYMLELEGYNTFGGRIPQATNPGKQTTQRVLCPPDTPYKVNADGKKVTSAIYDYENIHSIHDYISYDNGETFKKAFVYPASLDSKRLAIKYGDEGGAEKDGVIELRRGVPDTDLGNSHYAQVRVLVDGTHYLKGMAVYADDLPDGVDVRFNTNKPSGTPMTKVLKPIGKDPDNPFGALIKEHGGQNYYKDKDGKEQLGLINKTREQGEWGDWEDHLPSQFLAKQSQSLIKKQLGLSIADKQAEFDEICSLQNPTVKRNLLKSFSDDCDATALNLEAAALPRQKWHVMLPVKSLSDKEVYAPQYNQGEKVALVRYPHAGIFEIPVLTVNNRNKDAQKLIGADSSDAVCINSKVAAKLSGADFDGDTVMLIPTGGKIKITTRDKLKGLRGSDGSDTFDPGMEYPKRPGMKVMTKGATQKEMGVISNLIMDMTLKGANDDELAQAVKHSMVVIDAAKHEYDYKRSEIENNIAGLKRKYQGVTEKDGRYHEGAATLITRAKSQVSVPERRGQPSIDPDTGELIYKLSGRTKTKVKRDGTVVEEPKKVKSRRMTEVKDARELSSGTPQEEIYADYANYMKSLANQARKEMINTGRLKYSASAKETYAPEVSHLMAQLGVSSMNAPRERAAQRKANSRSAAKKLDNPDMTEKEYKKIKQQELTKARNEVGAKRTPISISQREWEAIQAGAITDSKLSEILRFADADTVRKYATPRTTNTLSTAKANQINAMRASNYTIAEIAQRLGVSSSTVSKYLK